MNQAVIAIIGMAVRYGIPAAQAAIAAAKKDDPTPEDFQKIWDRAEKDFDAIGKESLKRLGLESE